MWPFLLSAAALVALAIIPPGLRLHRLFGGRSFRLHLASGLLIAAGAVAPAALGVVWYAAVTDFRWASAGPFPFSHLGAKFWPPVILGTGIMLAISWGLALWLKVRAHGLERR